MTKKATQVRGAAVFLTAAALSLTTLLAAGSAQAAPASIGAGRVQLCSQGNYSSFLEFEPANGSGSSVSTDVVAAGACQTFGIANYGSVETTISVHGKYNSSNSTFVIGSSFTVPVSGGGWKVFTQGTTATDFGALTSKFRDGPPTELVARFRAVSYIWAG